MASSQSFSMIHRRMLLSPCPASPVKRELPLCTSAMRLPRLRAPLHLAQHVGEEEHLPVAGAGDEAVFGVVIVLDQESLVLEVPLATHAFEVGLPRLAVGRIGEHEVELAAGEGVVGEGRAEPDVVRLVALALEDEVGLADGIGLRVHLLPEQVDRHVLVAPTGEPGKRLFRDRQHPARAAGAVVDEVRARLDLIGHRLEDEVRHKLHHVARGEVFARLLVVLLVEPPDQLLEDGAHRVVVEPFEPDGAVPVHDGPGTEVDGVVEELLDEVAEGVGLDKGRNLVAKLELVEDLLHVGGEAVEVRLEVGAQLLSPGSVGEIAKPERRSVVEGLAGRLAKGGVLVRNLGRVEARFHAEHRVIRRFQHGVQAADDGHGQDDVAVLAPHIDVTQHVVRDAPDEVADVQAAHAPHPSHE